ncbi:type II toxin-antitoxin system RelE family toxin [Carbonactinospora thermoautotrophica]|uniref:type II toxin-antitoxin system RelE family toxin n=1 Tax=Carbonactinospora thermoautotrophica TaxID=1469144 RepID=UPI00226E2DCB|nr:type II toxin-antitoxin system RelE/ParE family toxin [Carbonactinospora thermoautotrophica]
MSDRYDLLVARPTRRALTQELPIKIAMAVWELLDRALRDDPYRVGKPLRDPFVGQWVARRSSYRVRYRIDEDKHAVVVLDVRARADAYHPRRA